MPQQPNGNLFGRNKQAFKENNNNLTGFSFTINFICPNVATSGDEQHILNTSLDPYVGYYDSSNTNMDPVLATDGSAMYPQFIVVSVYNDDRNPWLEAKLDAEEIRFEFRTNSSNHPFDPDNWAQTHSVIADGIALNLMDSYFHNGANNPYNVDMFYNLPTNNKKSEEVLACGLHPGRRSTWNTTSYRHWACRRTFMTKTAAMAAPLDVSVSNNEGPRYLQMRLQYWDAMNSNWASSDWIEYGVLINNNTAVTPSMYIYDNDTYLWEMPVHRSLIIPYLDVSKAGYMPAGDNLTHGENLFNSITDLTGYQCFALQGGVNDSFPGTDVFIDVVRQMTFEGANNGVGTSCLQYPIGDGVTDGLYKKKLLGSQIDGVTYNTVQTSTSLIAATDVYNQNTGCTTGQPFQSNSSVAGGHYHINLEKFYMYTEFLRSVVDPTDFGGPGSGNTRFGSNMVAYNAPKCWDQSEWLNDYIRVGFIPAPTNQTGGWTTVKMKPKITTPTGTGKMYVNKSGLIGAFPSMTAWSAYTLDGSMSGGATLQTGGWSNFMIIEPKSFCTLAIADHEAIWCLELININFGHTNATCSSNGTLKVDFQYSYGPDWATKGPDTWTVPIAFKIWDQVNSSWYSTLIYNITDTTGAGPQTATLTNVPPGTYVLTDIDVGPVKSIQYYNTSGQVFDGEGQLQVSAYTPNQTETVSGGTRNPLNPVITSTDVSCNGGMDGTITALIGGGQGFTPPTTVICSPGTNGAGSTTIGPTNAGSVTFTALNAGTHTLDFTDGAGCVYQGTIWVSQPSSLLGATETWTNPTTCVEEDGTITLSPYSGVPPYTVQWTNPNGTITGTTGLVHTGCMPGVWSWELTDSSGCPAANGTVSLTTASSGITITAVTTDPTSAGATDGTLDISVSLPASITSCSNLQDPEITWTTTAGIGLLGGTDTTCNPWPATSTTLNYTGLAAGTVTITANFGAKPNGCQETITVTLNAAATLVASAVGNMILCNGTNTGEVTVSVSGGATTNFHHYEFLLCTDVAMTTGCIGPFSSATSPYTFTGLTAGTYYATVTDWFGGSGTIQGQTSAANSATVGTQSGTTTVFTPTHPPCGGQDGKITLTSVTGGTSPYQYYITPASTGFMSGPIPWGVGTFILQPADTYSIITEDANGCQETNTVTLTDPAGIVPGANTVTDATCGLNNDGTLTYVAGTGGTAPLTYKLIGPQPATTVVYTGAYSSPITGLASGMYEFIVGDANGCEFSTMINISLTGMTLATTKSDQSCNFPASNDGSIDLTPTGGSGVYTYSWTGPGGPYTTQDLTGLAPGTYNVTVTDSNGCTASTSVDILQSNDTLENLSVTEVVSACPGGCAGVVVDVNGGDFPLFLEISDDGGATWTRVSVTSSTAAAQFNENFPAPAFGTGITINAANYWKENSTSRFCFTNGTTYSFRTVSVTNSCPSNILTWNPSPSNYVAQTLTETITQPTCCGCNNVSCNGAINIVINNGVPIAQGAAGVPGVLSYDWILKKDGIDISTIVTYNTSCNGGCSPTEYDEIDFTDLYPGSYEFTSTDDCGETVTETWVITDPRIYITDIVTSDQLCANGCADGTITVTATGGSSGTLQYSVDDGINWSASNVFTGIGQGTWRVWVRDPICGSQILFDPTDNVLTSDNGCYSDFVNGIWPAGTEASLSAVSALDMQLISTTHNSLPGSSDGAIEINLTAGTAPYEISIVSAGTSTPFDSCTAQTSGILTPGLSQYININGAAVNPTGITSLAAAGSIIIDNLSVAQDWNNTALEAWYRVTVKDSTGCISSIETLIDNGTLGIIGIYGATDCDCNCPEGYGLISPPPAPPALPCAGLIDVPPINNGTLNATNTIAQFGAANIFAPGYGTPNGGVLYVDSISNNATVFVSSADTFYKGVGGAPAPYNMQFTGTSNLLIPAVDAMFNVMQYGSIFDTRLSDIGVWLQQGPTVPALPINEWIGIPIEVDFASQANTILGIACHGNYRVSLDCALLLTSETIGGTQLSLVDQNNYAEYSMFPIAIPAGKHTLLIEVKNSTANNANYPGGIAFDLFQGQLPNTLSVTSVFATATTQATLDIYHLADVNGKPITSFDITNGNYDHPFVFGTTDGYSCTSGCARMNGGVITCQSDDTAECDLPINCPEYLIDLVECVGTLSNEVYSKMISGLLKNNLSVKEVWMVMIIKYLINHLNPCITMQDLLSWTKFLEDICPDCEPSVTIPQIADDQGTPYGGGNITEFDF